MRKKSFYRPLAIIAVLVIGAAACGDSETDTPGVTDAPTGTDAPATPPGEWRGPRIIGGQTVEAKKGDLIMVPRGTPHQRSTVGHDYTIILIKVFAEPVRAKP